MRTILVAALAVLLIGSSGAYAQEAPSCLDRLRRENNLPDSRLRSLQPTDTLVLDGIPYPVSTAALGGGTAESVCIRHEPVRARIARYQESEQRAQTDLRTRTGERDRARAELRQERERTKWERYAPLAFYLALGALFLMTLGFFLYARSVNKRRMFWNKHNLR